MMYSVKMPGDSSSTFSQLYFEQQEWPVCGIRNFRKVNDRIEYEIEFSKYDGELNYVGHLFKQEDLSFTS